MVTAFTRTDKRILRSRDNTPRMDGRCVYQVVQNGGVWECRRVKMSRTRDVLGFEVVGRFSSEMAAEKEVVKRRERSDDEEADRTK